MASNFKIKKWDIKGLQKRVDAEQIARLTKAAIHLQNSIKKNISTKGVKCSGSESSGTRSAPGEFPHIQCGELRRSISRDVDKSNKSARVGSNKRYAKYLELGSRHMQKRPFLRTTLAEERGEIKRILAG